MPCNGDYNEPTEREAESRKVCQLLVYVWKSLGVPVKDTSAAKGSREYYGDADNFDEHVASLCAWCAKMAPEEKARIIYDGKNPKARRLADWWDKHQAADRERLREERDAKRQEILREQAKKKLTPAEYKALMAEDR